MRKQTKLAAVLSAAALLAMGASMTSFAAAGWTEEDGTWVWLDNYGERATETWKRSGSNWFWLDENGEMATNRIVVDGDDKYFVDENGARVTNQWKPVETDDEENCSDMDEASVLYYYFGSTGKAYKGGDDYKVAELGGKKYLFDEDGHMRTGWTTDAKGNIYYLGTEYEGWAYTGWNMLEPDEDMNHPDGEEYEDEEWFYFKPSTGKAYKGDRKYIEGAYYAFDKNGVMDNKWVKGTPWSAATSAVAATVQDADKDNSSYYDATVGNQLTGWSYVYKVTDTNEENDPVWYYLESSKKGVPFNYNGAAAYSNRKETATATKFTAGEVDGAPVSAIAARVIKSKTYLFNASGEMMTGVYELSETYRNGGSGNLGAGIYYFSKDSGSVQGQMMTGKQTISYDGDKYYYNFEKTGKAVTNTVKDNSLYLDNGVRLNAEDGNSYAKVNVSELITSGRIVAGLQISDSKTITSGTVIISSSGKVKKSGTVTIDGVRYTVTDYVVTSAKYADGGADIDNSAGVWEAALNQ